jgi:xanthine dehydrogenase YagS FAD-binding subunit
MMPPFEYAAPTALADAVRLLGAAGSAPLAGGTDLLALMKDRIVEPKRLVNVKGIPELRAIRPGSDGIRIGAAVTLDELAAHPQLRAYRAIVEAIRGIAIPQVTSQATVGGNLLQRPRCWYFRNGMIPGADADLRYHAIFGNAGPARYVHASGLAPALVAFGASVVIAGPEGERTIRVDQLWRTPAAPGEDERTLRPGEILREILLPPHGDRGSGTAEIRPNGNAAWPLAAASVVLGASSASVVLGHVAPIPWRSTAAEKVLAGKTIDVDVAIAAGAAAVADAKPLQGNAYKVRLAATAVRRAVLAASGKEL